MRFRRSSAATAAVPNVDPFAQDTQQLWQLGLVPDLFWQLGTYLLQLGLDPDLFGRQGEDPDLF